MTNSSEWQGRAGRSWAREWQRTDRSFAALTPQLLAAIARQPGENVLDIGCGAGELALALAAARPGARITGLDISADLVAAAQDRGGSHPRVTFACADAARFVPADGPPDLMVSRHGVMFFADPPTAFAHLAAQAAPDAHLVFSCFRDRTANAWAHAFDPLLNSPESAAPLAADPFAPGPFAFADPDHIAHCLQGWRVIAIEPVDFAYVAGAGEDPIGDALAFFSRIGPSAARLAGLEGADRESLLGAMAAVLAGHRDGDQITFPAAAWVVTATLA